MAGDLNATLDNRPLRQALGGCVLAARGVRGLVSTLPASSPRWFGIQIDHVLVLAGTEPTTSRRTTSPATTTGPWSLGCTFPPHRRAPEHTERQGYVPLRRSPAAHNRDAVVKRSAVEATLIHHLQVCCGR
jgi:hypothetical protein